MHETCDDLATRMFIHEICDTLTIRRFLTFDSLAPDDNRRDM